MSNNIGTLVAGIGLDADALQNDVRKVEQSFNKLDSSVKKVLNDISNAEDRAKRDTKAYADGIKSLMNDVARSQAQLKLYQSDAGQALLKQRAALQKDIDKLTPGLGEQGKAAGGLTTVMGGLGRSIIAVAGAYLSLQGAQRLLRFIGTEGMAAEKTWNNVASSLKLHGLEVDRNIAQMKAFAAARQQATGIGDERIADAQIRLLDANIDLADSYRLVVAAQDLSVAKDMDIVTAADLIGKSIDSDVNALGRYGIQIDKTLPKQEQINQLLGELGTRFGGRAAAAMETTAGKMALLSATTGDLAENLYAKLSPAFGSTLDDLQAFVKGLVDATTSVEDSVLGASQAVSAFDKQTASLTPLIDRYDQLRSQAVLNASEQEELLNLIKEISSIMPGAVNAWGALGEAVGVSTEFIRKFNKEQRAALRGRDTGAVRDMGEELVLLSSKIKTAQNALVALQNTKFPDPEKMGFRKSLTLSAIEHNAKNITEVANKIRDLQDELSALVSVGNQQFDLSNVEEREDAILRIGQKGVDILEQNISLIDRLRRYYGQAFVDLYRTVPNTAPDISSTQPAFVVPAPDTSALDAEIDRTLQAYDILISSGRATAGQLSSIWEDYTVGHLQKLEKELAGVKTIDAEMRKTILGAAKLAMADKKIDAQKVPLDRAISLYQPILASQQLTVAELDKIWGPYSQRQLARIEVEAQKYPELGAAAVAAYRQAAEAALAAENIQRQRDIIGRDLAGYEKLLDAGYLSAETLGRVWGQYTDKRVADIRFEAEELIKLGGTIDDIVRMVDKMNQTDIRLKLEMDDRGARSTFDNLQSIISSSELSKAQFDKLRPEFEQYVPDRARLSVELDLKFIDAAQSVKDLESSLRAAGLFKTLESTAKGFRDQQIAGLDILLKSNRLTAAELEEVWAEYYILQQGNLVDLQAGWEKVGIPRGSERFQQLTDEFLADMEKRRKALEKYQKSWEGFLDKLGDDSRKLAEAMSQSFESAFFRAMEGEFVKFRDFVKAIVSDITRSMEQEMARRASQWLTKGIFDILTPDKPKEETAENSGAANSATIAAEIVSIKALEASYRSLFSSHAALAQFVEVTSAQAAANLGELGTVTALTAGYISLAAAKLAASAFGGGSDTGGGSPPGDYNVPPEVYAAKGGLFNSPTIAMIGEAGPEVVVPVSRLDDPSFWEGVGLGNRGGGTGGSVIVNMTIVTPDVPSFRASQPQLMAEAQVRAGQAFRRNR